MAHSCPICDSYCTCGGDIDDMQFDGTVYQNNCYHCECDNDDDDEIGYECSTCGYIQSEDEHKTHCSHFHNE